MKKLQWPAWLPYPSSWLNAFILSLLMTVVVLVFRITGNTGYVIAKSMDSPELFTIFGTAALLSPIPVVAVVHHLIHYIIEKFVPTIKASEIGKIRGLTPGIISWWEGLYAWLVIMLSTLISFVICTIILVQLGFSYETITYNYVQQEANINRFATLWIICAASFYQIEYLFKRRLTSSNSNNVKSNASKSKHESDSETELNKLRGELGLTKMKTPKNQRKRT